MTNRPDGLAITFISPCRYGIVGETKTLSYSTAEQLVIRGYARRAADIASANAPLATRYPHKVIDAFSFVNELDMLELRLNELDSVVDHFVIIEPLEFYGSTKKRTPCLAANWDVIRPFEKKIKYVILDRLYPDYTDSVSGWARENFQRNALMKPVLELSTSPNDVVIISDCDEIPRASAIRDLLPNMASSMRRLRLDMFFYNVNRFVGDWERSSVGTLAQYQLVGGFQVPRACLDIPSSVYYPVVPDAGWHFSNFLDIEKLRLKISNFAHNSDANSMALVARSEKELVSEMLAGKNIFHNSYADNFARRSDSDPRLPEHFLRNKKKYEMFTEDFLKNHYGAL
jgi:hypothetical protein